MCSGLVACCWSRCKLLFSCTGQRLTVIGIFTVYFLISRHCFWKVTGKIREWPLRILPSSSFEGLSSSLQLLWTVIPSFHVFQKDFLCSTQVRRNTSACLTVVYSDVVDWRASSAVMRPVEAHASWWRKGWWVVRAAESSADTRLRRWAYVYLLPRITPEAVTLPFWSEISTSFITFLFFFLPLCFLPSFFPPSLLPPFLYSLLLHPSHSFIKKDYMLRNLYNVPTC